MTAILELKMKFIRMLPVILIDKQYKSVMLNFFSLEGDISKILTPYESLIKLGFYSI